MSITIAPKILAASNKRSLAICLVGSQQTYFQLRAAFLSLAPSSAKGYYATARCKLNSDVFNRFDSLVTDTSDRQLMAALQHFANYSS